MIQRKNFSWCLRSPGSIAALAPYDHFVRFALSMILSAAGIPLTTHAAESSVDAQPGGFLELQTVRKANLSSFYEVGNAIISIKIDNFNIFRLI